MYGKLFTQILDSSIMEESIETRLLWHYLITLADEDGNVDMTSAALARRVNMELHAVNSALQVLSSPDPNSRSEAEEGRRIVPIREEGYGWHLVNHAHYRKIATKEDRRSYMRDYMRARREGGGENGCCKQPVNIGKHPSTSVSLSDADADADSEAHTPPEARAREAGNGADLPEAAPLFAPLPANPDGEDQGAEEAPGDGFEIFWAAFPRKIAKPDAKKAWKTVARERPETETLVAAIRLQTEAAGWNGDGKGFCPYPATWLRAHRWNDDPEELRRVRPGNGRVRQLSPDLVRREAGFDQRSLDTIAAAMGRGAAS